MCKNCTLEVRSVDLSARALYFPFQPGDITVKGIKLKWLHRFGVYLPEGTSVNNLKITDVDQNSPLTNRTRLKEEDHFKVLYLEIVEATGIFASIIRVFSWLFSKIQSLCFPEIYQFNFGDQITPEDIKKDLARVDKIILNALLSNKHLSTEYGVTYTADVKLPINLTSDIRSQKCESSSARALYKNILAHILLTQIKADLSKIQSHREILKCALRNMGCTEKEQRTLEEMGIAPNIEISYSKLSKDVKNLSTPLYHKISIHTSSENDLNSTDKISNK